MLVSIIACLSYCRHLWRPDPHFEEQTSVEPVEVVALGTNVDRFVATRTSNDSAIRLKYSTKVKVEVICEMNFEAYPFDSQTCTFLMHSLKEQKLIR